MDEPHYDLRQEGFSDGRQLLTSMKLDTKNEALLILPILYNAIYFIHQVYIPAIVNIINYL